MVQRDTSLKWILRFPLTNMINLTNMFLHQNIWKPQKYVESIEQVLHGKAGLEPCQVHQTPNLHDKHRYVIHYRTFQLYQELGVALKNIHRVIGFNQGPCLKEYIDFNTRQKDG